MKKARKTHLVDADFRPLCGARKDPLASPAKFWVDCECQRCLEIGEQRKVPFSKEASEW